MYTPAMRLPALTLATIFLAPLLACGDAAPDEAAPAQRVENSQMGIALAELPAGFEVENNAGAEMSLRPIAGQPEGRVWFEMGPVEEAGINLVEVVNSQRASFEELEGGTFSGSRELQMTNGRTAYYSRGRFDEGGQETEEFRISTLHPIRNQLMRIFYRYPAGDDSAERLNDILLVVGEVEAFYDGSAEPSPAPTD